MILFDPGRVEPQGTNVDVDTLDFLFDLMDLQRNGRVSFEVHSHSSIVWYFVWYSHSSIFTRAGLISNALGFCRNSLQYSTSRSQASRIP